MSIDYDLQQREIHECFSHFLIIFDEVTDVYEMMNIVRHLGERLNEYQAIPAFSGSRLIEYRNVLKMYEKRLSNRMNAIASNLRKSKQNDSQRN